MESIIDLFNAILKIAFVGGTLLLVTRFFKFKRFSVAKTDVQSLQARISQLRLALKAKVRRKSNTFRCSFKSPITEGDMIDNALKQLTENKLETGDDLQAYFDLSRRIVHFIQVENNGEAGASAHNLENNFMCSDFKTEMEIVRILKEMCELSSKINARVEEFNRVNPNQQMAKVDPLTFQSQIEISRIFKEETDKNTFKVGSKAPSSSSDDSGEKAS